MTLKKTCLRIKHTVYLYLGRESFGRLHHEMKTLHHFPCSLEACNKMNESHIVVGKDRDV